MSIYSKQTPERRRIAILEEALEDARRVARENANLYDRAREALKRVEFVDGEFEYEKICPWCKCHNSHAPDCLRQIALGK